MKGLKRQILRFCQNSYYLPAIYFNSKQLVSQITEALE